MTSFNKVNIYKASLNAINKLLFFKINLMRSSYNNLKNIKTCLMKAR